jgi:NADPH:quinone reductase-like Zn-dependent oxidoreductase
MLTDFYSPAWGTLRAALNLKSTDSLYIHGGSSSLGLALAGLAKSSLFNVSTVISTTRAEHKIPTVKASGADHVILDTGSVSAEVKRLTNGVGATKAVEIVGTPTLEDSCAALSPNGVVAIVGILSGVWKSEFDPMVSLAPSKVRTYQISFCPQSPTLDNSI